MRARLIVPLTGLVAALAVAGCGGGDSTTATTELSKSEFLAQGNSICKRGDRDIDRAAKKVFTEGEPPSKAKQEKFVTDSVIPNIADEIRAIDALPAPSGDEEQVQAIVDAAQGALDKVKKDPSLLTDEGQASDPFTRANKLADDYGLTKCGG
jgi:hypothetical protein